VIVLLEIEGAAKPRWDVLRNGVNVGSVERGAYRVKQTKTGEWLAICSFGGNASASCNSLLQAARCVLAARRAHNGRARLRASRKRGQ